MSSTLDFLKLIRIIDENQLTFFSTNELALLVGVESKSIQNYLETLANNELIIRLEKGKYCRTFISDENVIGCNLVQGGVVSYGSALGHYGLGEENCEKVFIASSHQKSNKSLLGRYYKFIKVRPHKYFGFHEKSSEHGSFRVTDPEKTLLDCFDLPQYLCCYESIISVFKSERFKENKLVEYGERLRNFSVMKRLAYLCEAMDIPGYDFFKDKVLQRINEKYTLLDPSGPDEGPFDSRWKIRNNMDLAF